MNVMTPAQEMYTSFQCQNLDDSRNALKEVMQEIVLMGLDRAGFFNHAAFYGGTALRIFHGLDRFSEDLDFSLLQRNEEFSLGNYLEAVHDELAAYGFDVTVEQKNKTRDTGTQSAYIKCLTGKTLVSIAGMTMPISGVPENENLKVKIEADTVPTEGAGYEVKYKLSPSPYSVRIFDKPSLFAGKLHALLFRAWKSRAKGRDFYDFLWYLKNKVPVNLVYLENRMRKSGQWTGDQPMNRDNVVEFLEKRFSEVDYDQIKSDVLPFIKDPRSLALWSQDFFTAVTKDGLVV
jgi:predicted nucleotidyltransferase component of viral defense system